MELPVDQYLTQFARLSDTQQVTMLGSMPVECFNIDTGILDMLIDSPSVWQALITRLSPSQIDSLPQKQASTHIVKLLTTNISTDLLNKLLATTTYQSVAISVLEKLVATQPEIILELHESIKNMGNEALPILDRVLRALTNTNINYYRLEWCTYPITQMPKNSPLASQLVEATLIFASFHKTGQAQSIAASILLHLNPQLLLERAINVLQSLKQVSKDFWMYHQGRQISKAFLDQTIPNQIRLEFAKQSLRVGFTPNNYPSEQILLLVAKQGEHQFIDALKNTTPLRLWGLARSVKSKLSSQKPKQLLVQRFWSLTQYFIAQKRPVEKFGEFVGQYLHTLTPEMYIGLICQLEAYGQSTKRIHKEQMFNYFELVDLVTCLEQFSGGAQIHVAKYCIRNIDPRRSPQHTQVFDQAFEVLAQAFIKKYSALNTDDAYFLSQCHLSNWGKYLPSILDQAEHHFQVIFALAILKRSANEFTPLAQAAQIRLMTVDDDLVQKQLAEFAYST